MKVLKGGELMIFLPKEDGKAAIAAATSHSLEINLETQETSSKDSGGAWQESEGTILNWTVTSENLRCVDEDNPGLKYDDLVDMMLRREKVEVVLGPRASVTDDKMPASGWTPATSGCRKGMAIITKISSSAPNGDKATFSVNLTGTGALEKVVS